MYNPPTMDYFAVFGLPVSFDIDKELLAQRYRELQRLVHPDNYANASEQERLLAIRKAADVNEAFQVLKNPLTRGQYLLQLQGIGTHTETSSFLDNDFLLEQMELREELAEIPQQTQPVAALNTFLIRINQHLQHLTDTLSQQFAQQNWQAAHNTVQKFNFFKRIREEAIDLEEKLL